MKPFRLRAVLFDFDGTLTRPGGLDFDAIRAAVGCPAGEPLLEYIEALNDPSRRARAHRILDDMEMEAAAAAQPNDGAEEVLDWLRRQPMAVGILTRNSRAAIHRALENFRAVGPGDFGCIVTRDDDARPKPHPDGVILAAERLGVEPGEILVVGDFGFDIQAGSRAGSVSVLLTNHGEALSDEADFTVPALGDLQALVRWGRPLPAGKLPADLLGGFLDDRSPPPPELIVRPGIGEDTAAVQLDGRQVLVLTADPITFATDAIGRYAVVVNANDLATSGARPRWLLATLLFPPGMTPSQVLDVMDDLRRACRREDIVLCGGHTELTDAVSRPVIAGTMAGIVARPDLVVKTGMRPGDRILITKAVAVEGTAIIAREFPDRLRRLGLPNERIARCRRFLDRLSVRAEAAAAAREPGVSAMHDVTEGGIATALEELSVAGGRRLRIDIDRVPIYPETEELCRRLDLDPLGLIGSGSLLICCRPERSAPLAESLRRVVGEVAEIGTVEHGRPGIDARSGGRAAPWPRFPADEITRLF